MFYTGIGSRAVPSDIEDMMFDIAIIMHERGFILRSGGANGSDTAFERGCDSVGGDKEIYLPWRGFNNNPSLLYTVSPEAYRLAEIIYGASWRNLSDGVKKLMGRNIHQVAGLGIDNPSELVVCWTPDGCKSKTSRSKTTGGTGQAIAYADTLHVPTFNLYNLNEFDKLIKHLDTFGALQW